MENAGGLGGGIGWNGEGIAGSQSHAPRLEERIRGIEEALKLLAQEQRHAREMQSSEREKFLLMLERELAKRPQLKGKNKRLRNK